MAPRGSQPTQAPGGAGGEGPGGGGTTNLGDISSTTSPSTPTTSISSITTVPSISTTTSHTEIQTGNPTGSPKASGGKSNAGTEAGIAIGCLVAGVLIAGLIFFFLARRRRGRERAVESVVYHTKGAESSSVIPVSTASAAGIVESNLPQPMSDSDIGRELSAIDTKIGNHVLSYYGGNVQVPPNAQFTAPGGILPVNDQKLSELLANPAHRPIALRMLVASILTSKMGMESRPEESLLPAGVASTAHSMPQIASGDGIRMAFFTKWRTLTAFLLRNSTNQDPQLKANIQQATADIDRAIGPFASPQFSQQDRLANLESIVQRGSQMASTLFSQPTFWKFIWKPSGAPSNAKASERLVVFPGLQKLTDADGRPLGSPVTVEQAKVVEI